LQKQLQEEKNRAIKSAKRIEELRKELHFQLNALRREIHKRQEAYSQVSIAQFCLDLEEMTNRQHVEMIHLARRRYSILSEEINRLKANADTKAMHDRYMSLLTASDEL